MAHVQVTNCTATEETTKQTVVSPCVYASLYLEIGYLLIFTYGTYHIRLTNVSKVFLVT